MNTTRTSMTRPSVSAEVRIDQVQKALGDVMRWEYPADAALSRWARRHPQLGARDRQELADAVFDVLRHLRLYRHFAHGEPGDERRYLSILGVNARYGATALASALSVPEHQWLRRVSRINRAELDYAVRHSLPDWLADRMQQLDEPETLGVALNQPAPFDLRINPLKVNRSTMLDRLRKGEGANFDAKPSRFSPWGIRLEGRPSVVNWPQYQKGEIEIQDEGSQILAALVAPKRGELIIDYCAGAGGKSLLLGALMRATGRLYAFDVSAARLDRARPRFVRAGLKDVVPMVIAADDDPRVRRLHGKAQRVLVDAPCTGLGTLRRSPDAKWRVQPDAVAEFTTLQRCILQQASRCVAPGGRLVYATCSLLPEENQRQVESFLNNNRDFRLIDVKDILKRRIPSLEINEPHLTLRPDWHGTDGFFGAVLEKCQN